MEEANATDPTAVLLALLDLEGHEKPALLEDRIGQRATTCTSAKPRFR